MCFCIKKGLNPVQRRFVQLFAATLLFTAVLAFVHTSSREGHLGAAFQARQRLFTPLPVIPFLAMMLLIPRYLRQEKDEFIRQLVVRALLWAFAVPMVVDTVWGFLWPMDSVVAILNVDLFCITAMLVLRMQSMRYA